MSNVPSLWGDEGLPQGTKGLTVRNFKSLKFPLWTENKARLIETYLRFFEFITKHGTYIDGFAAPQDASFPATWAAKLVLEMEPKWFRDFWLCDVSPIGAEKLRGLANIHRAANRRIDILEGDFNKTVADILSAGRITPKTATFALLDQRTFECHWRTVELLSRHKETGNKIEIFYFFPSGWIDRSLAAVKLQSTKEKVERWWGRSDWLDLRGVEGTARARIMATRFEQELGYGKAEIYPIHNKARGGRVMYHMIHATDHEEALPLMVRAYRKVAGRPELDRVPKQSDLVDLLNEIQSEGQV